MTTNVENLTAPATEPTAVAAPPPATEAEAPMLKKGKPSGKPPTASPYDFVIRGLDTKEEGIAVDPRIYRKLDPAMMKHIDQEGILVPVIVRMVEGKKEIIEGRQRVRYAREITKKRAIDGLPPLLVPYIVIETNEHNAALKSVAANSMRDNDDAYETAIRIIQFVKSGYSDEEIAKNFRVGVPHVKQVKLFENLNPSIQEAVREKKLKLHAALEWTKLSAKKQEEAFDLAMKTGATTKQETRQIAKAKRASTTNGESESKTEGDVIPKPGGVLIRHLIDGWTNKTITSEHIPEEFILALRFVRGEIKADRIKGLRACLRAIDKENGTSHNTEV